MTRYPLKDVLKVTQKGSVVLSLVILVLQRKAGDSFVATTTTEGSCTLILKL